MRSKTSERCVSTGKAGALATYGDTGIDIFRMQRPLALTDVRGCLWIGSIKDGSGSVTAQKPKSGGLRGARIRLGSCLHTRPSVQ